MDWKEYEKEIHSWLVENYPAADISYNAKLPGFFSKTDRQIDVLVEDRIAGSAIRLVVDAKYHYRKIDVKDVEAFVGMLRDVKAHKGIMISSEGYSRSAINRAFYDDFDLDLDILNFKELKQFQAHGAIVYSGSHAVLLTSPFGWIVDGAHRDGALACLYQRGFDLSDAGKAKEWMYVNFWIKDEQITNLDLLLQHQQTYLKAGFPTAKIELLKTIERPDAKTALRSVQIESYPTPEYTGFVEFSDFIFFCVLFTQTELAVRNLKKLEYVLERVIPANVQYE